MKEGVTIPYRILVNHGFSEVVFSWLPQNLHSFKHILARCFECRIELLPHFFNRFSTVRKRDSNLPLLEWMAKSDWTRKMLPYKQQERSTARAKKFSKQNLCTLIKPGQINNCVTESHVQFIFADFCYVSQWNISSNFLFTIISLNNFWTTLERNQVSCITHRVSCQIQMC